MSPSIKSGVVYLTVGQFVFIAAGFVTHFLLGRSLGPSGYGTYGVILYLVSTFGLLLTAGIPEAVSKYIAENPSHASGVIRSGLILQGVFSLSIALVLAVCAPLIASLLHDQTLTPYLRIAAMSLPFVGMYAVSINIFNGLHNFRVQGSLISLYGLARLILIVLFVRIFQLTGAASAFVLAPFMVVVAAFLFRPRLERAESFPIRRLIQFALPVVIFSVLLTVLMNIDLFTLKSVNGNADLIGLYAAASTISKVPYFIFSAVGMVLLPIVSRALSNDRRQHVLSVVAESTRALFIMIVPVVLALAILSPQVLSLLYSPSYAAAALPLALLLGASVAFSIFFIIAYALNGAGHPVLPMVLSAAALILHVPALIIGARLFAATGAAAVTLGTSIALALTLLILARRHFGSLLPGLTVIRVMVAGIILIGVGKLITVPLILAPLLGVLLVAIYLAALYYMREFKDSDVEYFRHLIPKFLWRKPGGQPPSSPL